MKTLIDHLSQYAEYHRDRRNIATHFVGIPLIVLAIAILLALPAWSVTPVDLLLLGSVVFYLRLSVTWGLVMAVCMGVLVWLGYQLAALESGVWWGLGLFVVGWAFQFVGHYYEKRKPAFVDDLVGLLIGPLFVVVELAFMLGLARPLQQAIEARVGPTLIRE